MALKNYYELLEVEPAASQDEIKRAFRHQIARYHPDKVQHLGKEFQEMAADRAAELTEAYRILSDANLREQYNQSRGQASPAPPPDAAAPSHAAERPPAVETPDQPKHEAPKGEPGKTGAQFSRERATRDEFVCHEQREKRSRERQLLQICSPSIHLHDSQPTYIHQ